MSDLKTALQSVIDSGALKGVPLSSTKPKQQKRRGQRSTGELTLRTLRWLVDTRLSDVEAGVSWQIGRELLGEINERLDAYEGERGPRGPSSVDKSAR